MLAHHVRLFPHSTDSFDKHSISQDFCKEALAWRSLSHRFILPLLGIFEDKLRYLVSPLMTNGTLAQWRKNKPPSIILEVHRLVRF